MDSVPIYLTGPSHPSRQELRGSLHPGELHQMLFTVENPQVMADSGKLVDVGPPVNRVPAEILAHIFLFVNPCDFTPQDEDEASFHRRNFTWSALIPSWVCQYWRDVALTTPALWTEVAIGSSSVELVDAYVSRSKLAPLRVWANIVSLRSIHAFRLILGHFHRLQWLYLKFDPIFPDQDMTTEFMDAITANFITAPKLLSVFVSHSSRISQAIILPISISPNTLPKLQELHIYYHRINWVDTTLPRSLTRLTIWNGSRYQYISSDVFQALKPLQKLTHLSLAYVLPTMIDHFAQFLPPISCVIPFPALQSLELAADMLACVHFLHHCELPDTTEVALLFELPCTVAQLPLLAPSIPSLLRPRNVHSAEQPTYQLEVDWGDYTFHVHSNTRVDGVDKQQNAVEALQFLIPVSATFARRFLSHLTFRDVTTLRICNVSLRGETSKACYWNAMTSLLKSLRTLEVSHCDPSILVPLLNTPAGHGLPSSRLPRLKHLILHDMMFRNPSGGYPTSLAPDICSALLERDKRFHSNKLEKITLKECRYVDNLDVEILQKLAVVDWDGRSIGTDYYGSLFDSFMCQNMDTLD